MTVNVNEIEMRFWVAKPCVPEQTIGSTYRLSLHPDPRGGVAWWQLEIEQGEGWRRFRCAEKANEDISRSCGGRR